jgi:hypothetical protein
MPEDNWNGEVERRESKRRYTLDRRLYEKRKKYWINLLLPIVLGVVVTGIVSWAAYVTHLTYGISAKYEQSFVSHINDQLKKDALIEHKMELLQVNHDQDLRQLKEAMETGFKEMRSFQHDIYKILAQQTVKPNESK